MPEKAIPPPAKKKKELISTVTFYVLKKITQDISFDKKNSFHNPLARY